MISKLGPLLLISAFAWAQPEVSPDRRVTFRVVAPKASEVLLSGEFMKGTKPLEKDATGVWSVTVGPLEPEIYYYNLTIDGVKTIDPGNPDVKTGSTPSTISSILEVKGDRAAFYDGQPVPHGEIHTNWYHSKSLGTLRRVTVYTPPGYEAAANVRYPVLYLFHGANADEAAWTRLGHVNLILDNLLAANKAKPFVVVMPFGYGVPPGAPRTADSPDNTTQFSRDLLQDLIPFVQARYRVSTHRTDRAIAGLSMGGGESLSIGLSHIDLFAYVAGFSAGLRAADISSTFGPAVASPATVNDKLKLLWVGCGTEDGLFAANRAFDAFLTEHQIKHIFHESSGAHTWMVWRRYLNELAPRLFQPTIPAADPPPLPGKGWRNIHSCIEANGRIAARRSTEVSGRTQCRGLIGASNSLLGPSNQFFQTLSGAWFVILQRQDAFVNRIQYPRGLRKEQGFQFRGGRDPVARAQDNRGRVEVIEAELR
jgi:enterochelin esterase family protein